MLNCARETQHKEISQSLATRITRDCFAGKQSLSTKELEISLRNWDFLGNVFRESCANIKYEWYTFVSDLYVTSARSQLFKPVFYCLYHKRAPFSLRVIVCCCCCYFCVLVSCCIIVHSLFSCSILFLKYNNNKEKHRLKKSEEFPVSACPRQNTLQFLETWILNTTAIFGLFIQESLFITFIIVLVTVEFIFVICFYTS